MAHAKFHPAERRESLVQQLFFNDSANGAINDAQCDFAIREHERQCQGFEFRNDARHVGSANPGQRQRAGAHCVDVFLRAAELHGGEHINLQFVVRALRDLSLEHLFDGDAARVFGGEIARDLELLLRLRWRRGEQERSQSQWRQQTGE
ncbi:hypothetical protein D9M68_859040 [compost metagenome]